MTSDGAPATSRQSDIVNAEDKSRSDEDQPGTASVEPKAIEDSQHQEEDQDTSAEVHENAPSNEPTHSSSATVGEAREDEGAAGASTSSDFDSSAKKASSEEPSSNTTTQKSSIQEQRTAELIKKQMSEIEKEINRRIQNKNIKKIDETELAQLLNDHGFGSFVDAAANPELAANFSVSAADQAGLPYRAPGEPFTSQSTETPSLNQLRSSFSPPEPPTAIPPQLNGYSTAGAQGIALNGGTSPLMPQGFTTMPSYPYGHQPTSASPTVPINSAPVGYATPGRLAGSFYAAPQMPQQQNVLPPVSAITPEVAAALLQQLQQQNPSLLQSLVGGQVPNNQQASTNGSAHQEPAMKSASTIPAPPPPANNVSRRPPGGSSARHHVTANRTASSTSTSSWALGNDDSVWNDLTRRHGSISSASSNEPSGSHHANGVSDDKENHQQEPVWQMRDSYLKRLQRDEMRNRELHEQENGSMAGERLLNGGDDDVEETDKLLKRDHNESVEDAIKSKKSGNKKEVMVHEPAVLIEGVLFRARYLGSTQLTCDGRATKTSRMGQAQEAVARVKAPEGEIQPSTEIDLFISTEKIMVLNTDLQRISETDVRQDILMDHALRSISYIADIGDLVVLMARRVPQAGTDDDESDSIRKTPKVVCHVFESDEAAFIAQSIGQAFQVAYVEFLRANGIDDPAYLREIDYQEVLNAQELLGEELELFARKETQKDIVIRKKVGEALGVVVVESGWGSMLPTVVVANMAPGGAASRSNELNIGDQIIGINGISLVGLPLAAAQQNIKNAKSSTAVRLTVVHTPPVVEVRIKRPDTKYQLGFSVQNGVICSLLRGGIAERGGIRVGHRIIEINHQSVVAVPHEKIVNMLATATGEIHMKTMPTSMFRLLTGQEIPNYI
ncbi:CRE-LIN-10 protein [Aphelenchoides avenae]|nr:CRE-LIN-10 protein [Aphelenchus avenae]